MFKNNNKDTRMTFIPCSSNSIVNFEHVIAGRGMFLRNVLHNQIETKNFKKFHADLVLHAI